MLLCDFSERVAGVCLGKGCSGSWLHVVLTFPSIWRIMRKSVYVESLVCNSPQTQQVVLDFLLASGTAEVNGTGNHRRESRWNTLVLLQYICSRNGTPHYKSKSCVCLFFSAGLCRKVKCTLCYKQYLNSVDWHRHFWDTKLFVTGQN